MTVETTMTRQELYDLVWQTPMVKLAEKYGISGRGLAKLCERHDIPVPGRGHWALTRAGYVMERDPLPDDPSLETEVSITGDPERRKEREEHPDVAAQIAYEAEHPIVVPAELRRPHSLVAASREVLRPRRPETLGTIWQRGSPLEIHVSPKQLSRALRIFDSLLKACEERGFGVSVGEEQNATARIDVKGEGMAVSIREPSRRTDHILTAREREEQRQGRGWSISRYDYNPSGRLILTIEESADGNPHRWSDREKRPLEDCLNDIVVSLVRISVTVLKPRQIRWERERQIRAEEDRRRQIYWSRMNALTKNLQEWQKNQELRKFIAAVEDAAENRDPTLKDGPFGEWLSWAQAVADQDDPLEAFINQLAREQG